MEENYFCKTIFVRRGNRTLSLLGVCAVGPALSTQVCFPCPTPPWSHHAQRRASGLRTVVIPTAAMGGPRRREFDNTFSSSLLYTMSSPLSLSLNNISLPFLK